MLDDVRGAIRSLAMIMIGYAVVAHAAADRLSLWFDCRLPDPLTWLPRLIAHWQ